MKKKSLLFASIGLVLLMAAAVFSVHEYVTAQSAGQGLEVSPPSQEVAIDPGKTTIVKAKIRNKSNTTLPLSVHIEDFTAKGDQGQIELNSNSPYSVVSWTKVAPSSFSLAPGEEQEVTATITAPTDAAGGHFGSFVFSAQSGSQVKDAASVSQEIASLFLVRVSGPVDEKLSITSFSAPGYSEFGPVPFNITFTNGGNVYVKTFGLINVTDMFGRKVDDVVVTGTNVFPQADRVVSTNLNKKFLFGSYTATALMYYGSQNQSITATTTFFVFPTRIAVIVLVVLLLLYLMRKRLGKALKALFG
jgi:hypothetical protein